MIKIIKSKDRHFKDMGWLKTFWLFSFSDYYDPENISHGALKVFNDDVVEPHKGFETHPHKEMEIVSIVLEGEMVHKDTMGNETAIQTNDVQRMTAGKGLYHSEKNSSNNPVHFYQIWIEPDKKDLRPSYDQKVFNPQLWHNKLALLASDADKIGVVKLNTDASIYRAALDKDHFVNYELKIERKAFIYVIKGTISLNGLDIKKNDQARISEEPSLHINTTDEGEFLLIDVPTINE